MTVDIDTRAEQIIDELLVPYEDSDDPSLRTHIVNPPMNRHVPGWTSLWEGQDVVDMARFHGCHVVALCGYRFIPKHNPDKYDACEACIKIAGDIMGGLGE